MKTAIIPSVELVVPRNGARGVKQHETYAIKGRKVITMILSSTVLNQYAMKHHRGVIPPASAQESEQRVLPELVITANLRLAANGYTMSNDLLNACMEATEDDFQDFYASLCGIIEKDSQAIMRAERVWPNYPLDVMQASMAHLYLANLLHYLTDGRWRPNFNIRQITPQLDMTQMQALKVILLGDEMTSVHLAAELISNNAPMSPEDIEDTGNLMRSKECKLSNGMDFADCVAQELRDREIPIKENMAYFLSWLEPFLGEEAQKQRCFDGVRTAKDVLRLAVAASNGDVSMAENTRFRSFSRSERRAMLALLERTGNIEEYMAGQAEQWKRLGERLHPSEYSKVYPKTAAAFDKIRAGEHIETYNSKLEQLLRQPVDMDALVQHLGQRTGVFARYLDFCLRNCKDEEEQQRVLFQFTLVAQDVPARLLLRMIIHFMDRNNPVQLSVGKANGAKARTDMKRSFKPIDSDMCNRIVRKLRNELWQVLRKDDESMPTVFLDPAARCDNLVFPDTVRNMSPGLRVCASGSRLKMPKADVIRSFVYWKADDGIFSGIDVDLSAVFFDEQLNVMGRVSYQVPKFDVVHGVHSGDRRSSGENGSSEYIDFSISAARGAGVRYMAMLVNSYSGELFSSMGHVFCGIMARDGKTGDVYEPATVSDKFDICRDSRDTIPIMLDLWTEEVIVVDRIVGMRARANSMTDEAGIRDICQHVISLKALSVADVMGLRFSGQTDDVQQADIIITENPDAFSDKKAGAVVVNPFDTQSLLNLVFSKA